MKIEICAVGGYSEVGKNMTAIKYGDEVIICDMGFFLPEIIRYEDEAEGVPSDLTREELLQINAVPNDDVIYSWKDMVKAIVASHCHLDHIGAIPYLCERYDAPVIGTPYTIEVLKSILKDENITIANQLRVLNMNAKIKVSENITIEFIGMTHSTPQTVMIVVHTPAGIVAYANDFKLDNHPVLGKKPNYDRIKELGNSGKVIALICDSLYSGNPQKTPSEKVAREMLKDVLLGTDHRGHAVVVTTFASHIARLKSIIDFGKKMKRKIVMLGRSMHKYVSAAERIHLVNFTKDAELVGYSDRVKRKLKQISAHPEKYLIVCTGNQGEPRAILSRLANNSLPFKFKNGDHVVFSCKTIPAPINIANRALLEDRLKHKGVRLFVDIHTSGHGSKEDIRDLITMIKPKHIIPSHGDASKTTPVVGLAKELGYSEKTVHIMRDGEFIEVS